MLVFATTSFKPSYYWRGIGGQFHQREPPPIVHSNSTVTRIRTQDVHRYRLVYLRSDQMPVFLMIGQWLEPIYTRAAHTL
ncbi:hypothetical protein RSOLAG1IB_08577 [Rhizoctonia solani AG-1 IB]|uniref:Uncharacterized protein n=1 Tax=Thanatephorus cucumeris (strain AG1-IB / isolate 7/3/14) TaxID=1108050 RepID=A0A0B7FKI3_THACB|nr:hypothetical protein RSOLAG1IB_08577 [Rhizoctonia solani AG-1 IB]